jgi:2-alkyl-3-oxoalkanoate reductase
LRVAVTGAAGLLGRSITRYLASRGVEVRAIVRTEGQGDTPEHGGSVSIVAADVRSLPRLVAAFSGCDGVVHSAAQVQPGKATREFYTTNVLGTRAVLAASREAGVSRLVHISSQSVYDLNSALDGEMIDEDWPTEPRPERRGAYSRTKLAAEHLVRRAASLSPSPHIVILRPGALYAPDRMPGPGPLGKWLPRLTWGVVLGRPDAHLNFTHVDNVAEAVRLALFTDVPSGSVFNIVDDEALTQRMYLRMVGRRALFIDPAWARAAFQVAWAVLPRRSGLRQAFDPSRIAHATTDVAYSTLAARQRLGWSPVAALEDGTGARRRTDASEGFVPRTVTDLGFLAKLSRTALGRHRSWR